MQNRSEVCSLSHTLRTLGFCGLKGNTGQRGEVGLSKQKVGVRHLMLNLDVENAQPMLCNPSSGQAL